MTAKQRLRALIDGMSDDEAADTLHTLTAHFANGDLVRRAPSQIGERQARGSREGPSKSTGPRGKRLPRE